MSLPASPVVAEPAPSINESVDCIEEEEADEEAAVLSTTEKTETLKKPPTPSPSPPKQSAKNPTSSIVSRPKGPLPYIADPLLCPRVLEYITKIQLESKSKEGEHYVDVEEIMDELQRKYKEYRKKKRGPFKASVQKALTVLMIDAEEHSDVGSSGGSGEDSDMMEMDERPESNDQIVSMYLQNKAANRQNKVTMDGDKELIDIGSSDDDEEEEEDENALEESLRQSLIEAARNRQHEMTHQQIQRQQYPSRSNYQELPVSAERPPPRASPNIIRKRKSPPELDSVKTQQPNNISKKRKCGSVPVGPKYSFKDIGGNEACLKEVCQLLVHMKHPEVYSYLGVTPPRGFLLHGPPGCGKTLLAHAIAGELELPFLKVAATELVAGVSGESEERIRELFDQAVTSAPCVLFIDEIDAIAPHRATAQREMERRIVAQLLASLDDLAQSNKQVLVVGATNRPDSLDPALRRAGRFDREVSLGIPDETARSSILKVLCAKLKLDSDLNLAKLGRLTPGFVGADLAALTREAAMVAVNRVLGTLREGLDTKKETSKKENSTSEMNGDAKEEVPIKSDAPLGQLSLEELTEWLKDKPPLSKEQLETMNVQQADFEAALKFVQPSAKREGFATVPGVTWDDVGSLKDVREELKMAILAPIKFAEEFSTLGLSSAAGVLLCGPPGCGKTLLAKAVANEAGINFISVKGPELLNMYVGESERAVRQCFQRAKNSAPCVIFFDELDALCPKRSETGESGASSRVVNQMLTEMDGVEGRRGVFLMAATNRPDMVDPAVLRPGRLDKTIYIGLPGPDDRTDILRALTKNGTSPKFGDDVKLADLGSNESTSGYTGADLAALVREASLLALRGVMMKEAGASLTVFSKHFTQALAKIRPSVSDKDKLRYESLRLLYGPKATGNDS